MQKLWELLIFVPMVSFFLQVRQSDFHLIQWGKGPDILICFPGFGESAHHFSCLEQDLGQIFTLVAVDLPYHGLTRWQGGSLEPGTLILLAQKIMERLGVDHFSILGYSLGGRVALALAQALPHQVRHLILLAPDGVLETIWYRLANHTRVGRGIFRWSMDHPKILLAVLHGLYQVGWIKSSRYKFVMQQMDTPEKRKKVLDTWATTKNLRPDLRSKTPDRGPGSIPLLLVLGKYDGVISTRVAKLMQQAFSHLDLVMLPKGHQLLDQDLGPILFKHLQLH
ncbi:MAG: alpha/beta fold hydrolase [Chitinophagaceae bacterium]